MRVGKKIYNMRGGGGSEETTRGGRGGEVSVEAPMGVGEEEDFDFCLFHQKNPPGYLTHALNLFGKSFKFAGIFEF